MVTEPSILTTGLFTHIETLRRTLYRLAIVLVLTTLTAYAFAQHLLNFVKQPLGVSLIMYSPLEGFLGYIKVSIASGVLLTSPLVLYEINQLLQRACRLSRRASLASTIATAGLFILGVSFCYVVILPITLKFLLSYAADTIEVGISVSRYLSLVLGLSTACGVIFELPLVTLLLHQMGLLSISFLTDNRRYAIILSAIVTAIITPTPDAYTMTMLLVPLLALYEISILILRVVERRQTTSETATGE